MRPQVNGNDEEFFALQLAAYDDALATGIETDHATEAETEGDAELRRAKACLDQLELIWPRRPRADVETRTESATLSDTTPTQLGRFRILRELGRGGGGVVYLAYDPTLRRQVALKVPRPESLFTPELRRRFVREAAAAAQLNHRHIVPIHEVGEVGAVCYLVSAYCSGSNLALWLRAKSPSPRFAARIVADLASGVAHMHAQGILHRDIKPTNVLLEPDAGDADAEFGFVPRLTDFGLAKVIAPAASADERDVTHTGAIVGTPAYMAPEQAEGRLDRIGPATDIYALGVLLYEMLAGQPPFRGSTDVMTLQQIVVEEPARFRRRPTAVPRDLESICLKCLAKRPSDRYATAQDLALDLQKYLDGKPTVARPLTSLQATIKWTLRRPMTAALVATVVVFLLVTTGSAGWYAMQMRRHNTELREFAMRESDHRKRAEAVGHQLRLNSYADRFQRALEAREQGRIVQSVQELNELRPAPREQDLRGFEWYYLQSLCQPLRAIWHGHLRAVYSVAVSADGNTIASGSMDRTIRLWDRRTGRVRDVLSGHETVFVAFSSDGRTLASVGNTGETGELIVWDMSTARMHSKVELAHARDVLVAFAPDGKTLAVSTYHGIGFWDSVTAKQLAYYPVEGSHIFSLAFAPDGQTIATGNDDCTVRLWNVHTGRERLRLAGHVKHIWSLAFSPDGRTLATASEDRTVCLWDLESQTPTAVLPHGFSVSSVAFSPDGRTLVSAASDEDSPEDAGEVKLWDATTGHPLTTFDRSVGNVVSAAFVPGTTLLVVGCGNKTVRLLDTVVAPTAMQLSGHAPKETWSLTFSPDGRTLASAGDDDSVRLWNMTTGQNYAVLDGHESLVTAIAYSRDGRMLASASYDGSVKLWDTESHVLQATLSAHEEKLRCLALSPNAAILAAGTRTTGSAEVRLWETKTGRELPALAGHAKTVRSVAFSPDGTTLASVSEDGTIRWWDTATWRPRGQSYDMERVSCLAFAPNGQTLVSGNQSGMVRLWTTADGRERAILRGHVGEVSAVAFTPDGRTICSASEDKTVRLWQADTGRELMVLERHLTRVNAVAFTPDGRMLASASHDGIIRLWRGAADENDRRPIPRFPLDAGTVDETFGLGGKVTASIGPFQDQARAVAVQRDGKIVVAGYTATAVAGGHNDFAVARFLTTGELDSSFDGDGKAITAIGAAEDNAVALALQNDGKIVLVGEAFNGSNTDFAVARYNANGSLDTTFDGTGKVITSIGPGDEFAQAVAIQSDGKIIVAGSSFDGSNFDFAIVRYHPNGSLDTSFEGDGRLTTAFGSLDDRIKCMALQTDGKIVVAGSTFVVDQNDFAIARYNTDGTLDTTFDGDGKTTLAFASFEDTAYSVAIQKDGKIVAGGYSRKDGRSNSQFALARWTSDGTLDTSFDDDGMVLTSITDWDNEICSIALQPNGKIVAAGFAFNGHNLDFASARYQVNGSLDATFGSGGKTITAFGSWNDVGLGMAVQADGNIVVTGPSFTGAKDDFALVRYLGDQVPHNSSR